MIPIRPENRWGERRMLRVRIRRTRPDGTPWPVRPTAEILDDRVLLFEYGWSMDAADPYPGAGATPRSHPRTCQRTCACADALWRLLVRL